MIKLDGNATAKAVKQEIKLEVEQRVSKGQKVPHLAAILVGEDPASQSYVKSKVKDCEEVGFKSTLVKLVDNISQDELFGHIEKLNNDEDIDGFIVQLPLPNHIDEAAVTEAIKPEKDVDGFHPYNVGRMVLNKATFLPATPYGILKLLEHYNIKTEGKNCLVLGRSNIVGTPMSILLSRMSRIGNATVTLAHSRTQNLEKLVSEAEIIIAAIGKPEFLKDYEVRDDAVIIDVGINRVDDATRKRGYRLVGDVKYAEYENKVAALTPVPGGVGPMTRLALLLNTLAAVDMKLSF